jgi:hypothetical protein
MNTKMPPNGHFAPELLGRWALQCDASDPLHRYQSVGTNSPSLRQLSITRKHQLYGKYCELLSVIACGKHSYQCAIKGYQPRCYKTVINRLNIHSMFLWSEPGGQRVPVLGQGLPLSWQQHGKHAAISRALYCVRGSGCDSEYSVSPLEQGFR